MQQLGGVLFFPVTPFDAVGEVNLASLREHIRHGVATGPGGVFVACGTGEFHALAASEHEAVVRVTVEEAGGAVPVFAGTGGPLPLAIAMARAAQRAGASGLLMLPPYLVNAPKSGLVGYTRAIAAATDLPLIVYNRDNANFDVATAVEVSKIDNVVGFKDGRGDLAQLARIVRGVRAAHGAGGKQFQFFNGMPTAEAFVLPYRSIGVELYSSAVFCFAPEISLGFYAAVQQGATALVDRYLDEFFHPLVELRDLVPGYAVSLIKAAVRLRGLDVGGVRPPLIDPRAEHLARLREIIGAGTSVAAGSPSIPR